MPYRLRSILEKSTFIKNWQPIASAIYGYVCCRFCFPNIDYHGFYDNFFNLGLESWFSDRVRTVVLNSKTIAQAYLNESRQNIQEDILRIARD